VGEITLTSKKELTFSELSDDQQKAIVSLREKTTYLWLGCEGLLSEGGDQFSCNMRSETIDIIQKDLNVLVGAGFFKIDNAPQKDDKHHNVLDLQVIDISDDFVSVIKSLVDPSSKKSKVDEENSQINPEQRSHLSQITSSIRRFFEK
jgi:hypothetical protein